ncbi:MAG: hypothetical protein KC912_04995 [Proteobacteria bacterium]|nr:hypothetical protein [Pseudomonadota bacterium]
MGLTGLIWLGLAWAQEAPEPVEPTPAEQGAPNEIVVWGDLAVERARQEVIADFASEGYTDIIQRDNYVLLRSPAAWKGEIRVYDDGWVDMRRQPVRFAAPKTPWAPAGSPGAWASCILYPFACVKTGGQLVSKRKLQAQKGRTLTVAEPSIDGYGDRVADRETERTVNDLPDQLEALWLRGEPIMGEAILETPADRRAALLEYWDSRTDTVWGDVVRNGVEAFIRAEVQSSMHPFSAEEIARFNDARQASRELTLVRETRD